MVRSRVLMTTAAVLVMNASRPDGSLAVNCLDDPGDAAQVAAARAAIDSACDCFGAGSHGQYVSCASGIVNDRADMAMLRTECKGRVKEMHAHSVCGKDSAGIGKRGPVAPCVAESMTTGRIRCGIKPVFACSWSGRTLRVGCLAATSCIEAADTNGDLRIAAPGDTGDCTTFEGTLSDNGDGTIADSRTGLMWEKLSDDGSIHDWDDVYTYGDHPSLALEIKIAALNSGGGFAGHSDWRVPTIHELMTLFRNPTSPAPTVPPEFNTACVPGCTVLTCSCTAASWYWSSTSAGYNPELGEDVAASLSFSSGAFYALPELSALRVRAVRTAP